jgi:hypothetical protein
MKTVRGLRGFLFNNIWENLCNPWTVKTNRLFSHKKSQKSFPMPASPRAPIGAPGTSNPQTDFCAFLWL